MFMPCLNYSHSVPTELKRVNDNLISIKTLHSYGTQEGYDDVYLYPYRSTKSTPNAKSRNQRYECAFDIHRLPYNG